MAVLADCHLHSSFSQDSDTGMEEMICRGITLGLTEMCFTEHMDMDYPVTETHPADFFMVNTDSYLYDLIRYRAKYADRIKIGFGIELGLQPHLSKELANYVKAYDFDFVIGSSHICNGKDPYWPSFYEGRSDREAYHEYFVSILENIKIFSDFDVYGHLDYVVRYGPNRDAYYHYPDYQDILDDILRYLTGHEKGLEINTGALRNHLRNLHPCTEVLKRFRELGGEIVTVGSDAHSTKDIASGFALAADVLQECGFQYYATFEGRLAKFHKL